MFVTSVVSLLYCIFSSSVWQFLFCTWLSFSLPYSCLVSSCDFRRPDFSLEGTLIRINVEYCFEHHPKQSKCKTNWTILYNHWSKKTPNCSWKRLMHHHQEWLAAFSGQTSDGCWVRPPQSVLTNSKILNFYNNSVSFSFLFVYLVLMPWNLPAHPST